MNLFLLQPSCSHGHEISPKLIPALRAKELAYSELPAPEEDSANLLVRDNRPSVVMNVKLYLRHVRKAII